MVSCDIYDNPLSDVYDGLRLRTSTTGILQSRSHSQRQANNGL
ncbi:MULTISPECIES: hypothetical protein [unclassified Nostoc]|nr:hypothetical protein [Nostoc sp. DedQUE03]MDZ7976460.1 hypothetical protein [Nostoc sp. DedQUE03]MDZ8042783.1 hypothetical protein [Nostoc sp. DedQUE02]